MTSTSTSPNFGEHYDLCMIPLDDASHFAPDDRNSRHIPSRFYARSSRLVATTIQKIVETFGSDPRLRRGRNDIRFGHAASERASLLIGRKLGLPYSIYHSTHRNYGNTVSVSVPPG